MRCPSFAVPSVQSDMICVWPRVQGPEPCVRGLTVAYMALDRRRPMLLDDHVQGHPRLQLAHDVVLGRVHREGAALARDDLLEDGAAFANPLLGYSLIDLRSVLFFKRSGEFLVEPLG